MSDRSVAEKARIKPASAIAVLNEVPDVVGSLGLPPDVAFVGVPEAELVFVFVRDRAELERLMPPAVAEMSATAAIWVFFRKGSATAGLDMSRNDVWVLAEKLGLRPLGIVGVDDTWSAFRLKRG